VKETTSSGADPGIVGGTVNGPDVAPTKANEVSIGPSVVKRSPYP
jgi:hypothetical protein